METSETQSIQQESYVLLTSPEEGIPLVFYTVLVKMEPLIRKFDGGVLGFFRRPGVTGKRTGHCAAPRPCPCRTWRTALNHSDPGGCNVRVRL